MLLWPDSWWGYALWAEQQIGEFLLFWSRFCFDLMELIDLMRLMEFDVDDRWTLIDAVDVSSSVEADSTLPDRLSCSGDSSDQFRATDRWSRDCFDRPRLRRIRFIFDDQSTYSARVYFVRFRSASDRSKSWKPREGWSWNPLTDLDLSIVFYSMRAISGVFWSYSCEPFLRNFIDALLYPRHI